MSYYQVINGVKMDRGLLHFAEQYWRTHQDYSRIVPDLMNHVMDGRCITLTELRTLKHISTVIMRDVPEVVTFNAMLESVNIAK